MARRRMISTDIVNADQFIEMPATSSNLYHRLIENADDDGFVGNKLLAMGMAKASEDDLKILQVKNYVIVFPSGVLVIVHWKIHNTIQRDRYKSTIYLQEKSLLSIQENGMYTFCIQNGNTNKISLSKLDINNNTNMTDGIVYQEDKASEEEPQIEEPSTNGQPLQSKDIYSIIESEFGRTLSGMEYEVITDWIVKSKYSEELICLAIKEAVTTNSRAIRYIDRILHAWYVAGIKTVTEAEKQMEDFRSSRGNKTFNQPKYTVRKNSIGASLEKLKQELGGDSNG